MLCISCLWSDDNIGNNNIGGKLESSIMKAVQRNKVYMCMCIYRHASNTTCAYTHGCIYTCICGRARVYTSMRTYAWPHARHMRVRTRNVIDDVSIRV